MTFEEFNTSLVLEQIIGLFVVQSYLYPSLLGTEPEDAEQTGEDIQQKEAHAGVKVALLIAFRIIVNFKMSRRLTQNLLAFELKL